MKLNFISGCSKLSGSKHKLNLELYIFNHPTQLQVYFIDMNCILSKIPYFILWENICSKYVEISDIARLKIALTDKQFQTLLQVGLFSILFNLNLLYHLF